MTPTEKSLDTIAKCASALRECIERDTGYKVVIGWGLFNEPKHDMCVGYTRSKQMKYTDLGIFPSQLAAELLEEFK